MQFFNIRKLSVVFFPDDSYIVKNFLKVKYVHFMAYGFEVAKGLKISSTCIDIYSNLPAFFT